MLDPRTMKVLLLMMMMVVVMSVEMRGSGTLLSVQRGETNSEELGGRTNVREETASHKA